MEVRRLWQVVRTDLGDGPDQDEVPARRLRRRRGEKVTIETFIEDAKKSDPRLRNRRLIGGSSSDAHGRGKMFDVNTARKLVHVRVQTLAWRRRDYGRR